MKCIIHIGTPKTATTLLQKWLYENESILSEQSIALTRTFGINNNRFLATMFQDRIDNIGKREGLYDQRGRNRFKATLTDKFNAEFDKLNTHHHTVIFTSEHLYRDLRNEGEIRAFREWLLQWFDDIQVICYVREQSALLKSRYSNAIKQGFTKDMMTFADSINKNHSFYNYFLTFQKWESIFSKKALTLRIYDKNQFLENDIHLDFLHSALPNFDTRKLTFQTSLEKRALTNQQTLFARAINRAFVKTFDNAQSAWVRHIKQHLFGLELLKSGSEISYPGQHNLYQQMNSSNVAFFERYFGEKRNLFEAPAKEMTSDVKDSYSVNQALKIVQTICETKGLIVITNQELKKLNNLTFRLIESNCLTSKEALVLLEIIQKCQPTSIELSEEIIRMRKKELAAFTHDS